MLVNDAQQSRVEHVGSLRTLAAAVVRQAMSDLTYPPERKSATLFLTRRLWEPDNLWGSLLDGLLPARRLVLAEVTRRLSKSEQPPGAKTQPRARRRVVRAPGRRT